MAKNNVQLITVPDNLSLAESILTALKKINLPCDQLNILHGDTLIYELPLSETDVVAVGLAPQGYSWGNLSHENQNIGDDVCNKELVLAGYFSFSDVGLFKKSLEISNGHFVKSIELYRSEKFISEFEARRW